MALKLYKSQIFESLDQGKVETLNLMREAMNLPLQVLEEERVSEQQPGAHPQRDPAPEVTAPQLQEVPEEAARTTKQQGSSKGEEERGRGEKTRTHTPSKKERAREEALREFLEFTMELAGLPRTRRRQKAWMKDNRKWNKVVDKLRIEEHNDRQRDILAPKSKEEEEEVDRERQQHTSQVTAPHSPRKNRRRRNRPASNNSAAYTADTSTGDQTSDASSELGRNFNDFKNPIKR